MAAPTLPNKDVSNPPEIALWQLLIIFRNGVPFKAFNDPAEANLIFQDYKQDDPSSVYRLDSIPSDHLHFDAPIGTRMTSNTGKEYVSVYMTSGGDIIRDGTTVFIKA